MLIGKKGTHAHLHMQDHTHTHTHTFTRTHVPLSNMARLVIVKVRISRSFTKLFLFAI